ncbi:MAG: histidine triad nucleotide-binding protein [Paenibacillaceae bacterium]
MDCIFCKIIAGNIPSKKIFENDQILAFHDIQPLAAVHALIIPKKHIATMNEVDKNDWFIIGEIHRVAQQIARDLGIAESGYRLVNNCGKEGGQVVYHLHYHLLGGEQLEPLKSIG